MEKIRFTVQIAVLVLAFPLWFFAEMKQADKHMQHTRSNKTDNSSKAIKSASVDKKVPVNTADVAMLPFRDETLVCF